MANKKTEFIHVEKIRYWCNKILPLAYDDSLSYYEVLARVQEKINELIQAHNELPDYIKEAVIAYAHSDEFNDYIKTIFATLVVNVKYPPAGLKAAVGDGATDDSDAFQNVLDYCNANQRIMFIPDGKYVVNRKLYMSYPVIGASDDTVYIIAPKNTVVFSNETYETVTTTTPTTGEVVKTETKITGRSSIAKLKNVHCNPANIDFDADYIELIRVSANSVKLVSHLTSECTHLACAHLETGGVGHHLDNLVLNKSADPDIATNPLSFITHCGNLYVRSTGEAACVFDDTAVYPINSTFIGDCSPYNKKFYDEFGTYCATWLSKNREWFVVRGDNKYQVTVTKISDAYEINATSITLTGNPDLYLKEGNNNILQYHGNGSIHTPKETLVEMAKNITRTASNAINDNGKTVTRVASSAISDSAPTVNVNASQAATIASGNSSIVTSTAGVKAAYGNNTSIEANANGAVAKDGESAVEVKSGEGATLRDGSNVFVKASGEDGVFIEGDSNPVDIHGNEVSTTAGTVTVTGPTEVNIASKNLKLHDSNTANNWGITGTTGVSGEGAINVRTNTASILLGGKRIAAKPVAEASVKAGVDLTAGKSIIYNPSFEVPTRFNDYFNYVSAPDATGSNTSKLLFAGDKLAELLPGGGGGGGESVVVDVTNAGENSLVAGNATSAVASANSQKLNALAQTGNILYFPGGLVYNFGANDKVSAFHGITSYKNGLSARLVNLDLESLTHEDSTVVLDGFEIDHLKISNRMVDIKNCRLKTDSNIILNLCTGSISNCSTFGTEGLRPDIHLTNSSIKIDSLQNFYDIIGSYCTDVEIINCELNTVSLDNTNSNVKITNNFFSSDSAEQNILAISGVSGGEAGSIFITNNTFYHTNEIPVGGYMLSLTSCKNTFITNNVFQNIDQTNDKPIILSGVGIFAFNILESEEAIANIISAGSCDVFHNYNGSWT